MGALALLLLQASASFAQVELFPKNNAVDVNPDTRLKLGFSSAPPLNNQGKIRIYDASNDTLVDELDMSIPPGPRNTRTPPPYDTFKYSSVPDTVFTVNSPDTDTSHVYQKNFIGNTSESSARHFFPVLLDASTATISPHNNSLAYGKTYYVQIDPDVFPTADGSFTGIAGKTNWTFSTKQAPPPADSNPLVVAADGTGDFNTVQGAIDSIADDNPELKRIYIKDGIYDEIVVLRNKHNLTFHGEHRDTVIVRYATNGVFNSAGRSEFTLSGSTAINLVNLTIQSVGKDETPAQAEAVYVKGDQYQVHHVTMLGSGDALQIQASTRVFLSGSSVRGYGDNFLSYGAAFFKQCELISTYGPHGWPRNPETNHGDVFLNSTFRLEGEGTSGDGHCALARSPTSGVSFPYAEFVLISCKLQGITPEGWGAAGPDYTNVHFWEYDSVNLSDGTPVDVSKRVSYSRQLTMEKDAETIANYSSPAYVLAGWTPELAPLILTPMPESLAIPLGGSAELHAEAAAEPEPTYQWFKDGQALTGETQPLLQLNAATQATAGEYSVSIANHAGTELSTTTTVFIGAAGSQPIAGTPAMQSAAGGTGPQAGSAGAAMPTPNAGTRGGDVAHAGQGASPQPTAGVPAGPQGGAPGSAAGTVASNASPPSSRSSAGCSVGQAPGTHGAWPLMAAALLTLGAARRRRRLRRQRAASDW